MKKTGTTAKTLCFKLFHPAKRNSGWNCEEIQGCQWIGGGEDFEKRKIKLPATSEDLCNKVNSKERNNWRFQIFFLLITLSTKISVDYVLQRREWKLGLWSGSYTSYLIEEEDWFSSGWEWDICTGTKQVSGRV